LVKNNSEYRSCVLPSLTSASWRLLQTLSMEDANASAEAIRPKTAGLRQYLLRVL
jgi:hypothetical protein